MFLINKGREEGAKLEIGGERYGGLRLQILLTLMLCLTNSLYESTFGRLRYAVYSTFMHCWRVLT